MANDKNYNRRRFLQHSLLGAAVTAFPQMLWAMSNKIKSEANPNFHPDVELEFVAQEAHVPILGDEPKTQVQKFYGRVIKGPEHTLQALPNNYLGPILNLQKGQKVRVYFRNQLPQPSIIHWHGLHVPQFGDGHPMYTINQGDQFVYEFEVRNRAGTSFYHSHSHDLTAEQVYRGLAGLIVVSDDEEKSLELPSGEFDLPLVIQDRAFNDKNQLLFVHGMHQQMLGFLGDTILVNGKPNAAFSVKSRAYRFRAVNGSNSRIYKLGWDDGTPLTAIGTDAGLLGKPETRPYIMMAPGERVDLWLDFSNRPVGSKLTLFSLPFSGAMPAMMERMQQHRQDETPAKGSGQGMGMMGGMGHGGMGMMSPALAQGAKFPLATFAVTEKVGDSPKLPEKLVAFQRLTEADVDNIDSPIPITLSMKPMAPQLNDLSFSMDRVMDFEKVRFGSIKKIKIFHDHDMKKGDHDPAPAERRGGMGHGMGGMGMMGGGMGMMMEMAHPVHLHGQQFQILRRKSEGVNADDYATMKDGFIDSGWKDTVLVMPGETVEIVKPFQDYKGLFLYHCHNLEHENLNMMRQFYVY